MSTYNGWTNRETWLVNIWFMDSLDGCEEVSADYLQDMVEEHVYSMIKSASFVADMIDLGCIDWAELAENHNSEVAA
jgi:hypothetical protein